jgi:thiamine biosynthesis lipoprotein
MASIPSSAQQRPAEHTAARHAATRATPMPEGAGRSGARRAALIGLLMAVWLVFPPAWSPADGGADRRGPRPPAGRIEERFVYSQVHMGMQVRVVLFAAGETAARRAAGAAFAEIARLDAIFSDYRHDSELMRLAGRSGGAPVPVSDELFTVLERAQELWSRTGGAFDVTAGPLTALWRRAIREKRPPTTAELQRAAALTGGERMILHPESRAVELTAAGMRLDLGAIAKGYILDRALLTLRRHGVSRALIEAGGDIVAGAAPPGRDDWRVAIAAGCAITLAEAAVSTSGDRFQYVVIDGRRYSHTVDPRTGMGLTTRRTATVVAADGLTADALATALTLLDDAGSGALLAAFPYARAWIRVAEGSTGSGPPTALGDGCPNLRD